MCLSSQSCNLAWPRTGSCVLRWLAHLRKRQQHAALPAALREVEARLLQEHAAAGKRLLRLLRRAEAEAMGPDVCEVAEQQDGCAGAHDAPADSLAACGVVGDMLCNGDAAAGCRAGASTPLLLHAVAEVQHPALLPCGGAIYVQLTCEAAELQCASGAPPASSADQHACSDDYSDSDDPALTVLSLPLDEHEDQEFDATDYSHLCPAVGEALALALGCSRPSDMTMPHAAVTAAADDASDAWHAAQPAQPFPPPHGAASKRAYMWLERLELAEHTGAAGAAGRQPAPPAAVLHAFKSSQHLALRFSVPRNAHSTAASGAQRLHACVAKLCAALDACVVAVDVRLHPARTDTTWVLFISHLQHTARPQLCTELLNHLC